MDSFSKYTKITTATLAPNSMVKVELYTINVSSVFCTVTIYRVIMGESAFFQLR